MNLKILDERSRKLLAEKQYFLNRYLHDFNFYQLQGQDTEEAQEKINSFYHELFNKKDFVSENKSYKKKNEREILCLIDYAGSVTLKHGHSKFLDKIKNRLYLCLDC